MELNDLHNVLQTPLSLLPPYFTGRTHEVTLLIDLLYSKNKPISFCILCPVFIYFQEISP